MPFKVYTDDISITDHLFSLSKVNLKVVITAGLDTFLHSDIAATPVSSSPLGFHYVILLLFF